MIRSKFFSRFIVVTLTAALLLVSGSRAIHVSALAELAPEVAPVFDTQIYQLQDYVDELSEPQYDIYCILLGAYVVLQAGASRYHLDNADLSTSEGVMGWFKECGIQLHNSLIGFVPDTIRDPISGNIVSTTRIKELITTLVAVAMGDAVVAANYDTLEEFEQDFEDSDQFKIPINKNVQIGINSIFAIDGGLFYWQQDSQPFESNFTWRTRPLGAYQAQYNSLLSERPGPFARTNPGNENIYNALQDLSIFGSYTDLFINTNNGTWTFTNGSSLIDYNSFYNSSAFLMYYYVNNNTQWVDWNGTNTTPSWVYGTLNYGNYDSFTQAVQALFDTYPYFCLSDYVQDVYYGTDILNSEKLYNVTDLDFLQNDSPYYYQVDTDYNVDLKGVIDTIIDQMDLYKAFINNLLTIEGVVVTDPELTLVSIEILDAINELNPPLPVNLNDISAYTDNTYLDIVKERATAAGSTLANLVAFWHNCDFELVYVLFGAGITVLIGAFIGKWGHS